jgi:hypothetical protein
MAEQRRSLSASATVVLSASATGGLRGSAGRGASTRSAADGMLGPGRGPGPELDGTTTVGGSGSSIASRSGTRSLQFHRGKSRAPMQPNKRGTPRVSVPGLGRVRRRQHAPKAVEPQDHNKYGLAHGLLRSRRPSAQTSVMRPGECPSLFRVNEASARAAIRVIPARRQ